MITRLRVVQILLVLSAIFTIASGYWLSRYNNRLETGEARFKIVSLELAWSDERARSVVNSWSDEQRRDALMSIVVDYTFLSWYTLFLIGAVAISDGREAFSKRTIALMLVALIAGLCDVVENVFMTRFIELNTKAIYFSLPATIKFLFLLVVITYLLVKITHSLRRAVSKS